MKAIYLKAFKKHVSMSFKHKSESQVIIPTGERSRETFVQLQLLI